MLVCLLLISQYLCHLQFWVEGHSLNTALCSLGSSWLTVPAL